jgi:hypothetical protein
LERWAEMMCAGKSHREQTLPLAEHVGLLDARACKG